MSLLRLLPCLLAPSGCMALCRFACRRLGCRGVVFMPEPTPRQKVRQTRMWGEDSVEVRLSSLLSFDVAVSMTFNDGHLTYRCDWWGTHSMIAQQRRCATRRRAA